MSTPGTRPQRGGYGDFGNESPQESPRVAEVNFLSTGGPDGLGTGDNPARPPALLRPRRLYVGL